MGYDIFISYRRQDSALAISSFFKDLVNEFTVNRVFADRPDIKPGDPWPETISQALEQSKIVLVVISNNWFCTEQDNPGKLRLSAEDDWVRREIEMAQVSRKIIIPVLADISLAEIQKLFNHSDLPDSIKKLPGYQSQEIKTTIGDNTETKTFISFLRSKLDYLNSPDDLKVLLQKSLVKKYEVNEPLGAGAKTKVYLGEDKKLERKVAIKVVANPAYNNEFVNSLKIAAKITDSATNSISILGAYVDNDPFHVIMSYLSRGSLRKKIDKEKRFFSFQETREILIDIGNALIKMHNINTNEPITHCNVMPSNIILNEQGNAYLNPLSRRNILNCELLLNELDDTYALAKKNVYLEESCYLAPEIFDINPIDCKKIDQYMLGLTGYELLTREIPKTLLEGTDISDLRNERINAFNKELPPITKKRNDCPQQLARIIQKMIDFHPKKRYDKLQDAIDEISKISLKEFEIARDSYTRCLNDGDNGNNFFREFYRRLIDRLPPEEGEKFKRKRIGDDKSNKQYAILREAIFMLLLFCENKSRETEPHILTRIAEMHNITNYNIAPDLYEYFTNALTDTVCGEATEVKPFDNNCIYENEKQIIKEAWLNALRPGIDYMISRYRK